MFFMFFFVFFLSLMCLSLNNVLIWWSIFLLMTLLLVALNKKTMSYGSLFNYFILQESLGLVFLMLSFFYFQLLILFMKIGVAPLHFWIFSITNNMLGFNLMWFLTFQKLPFLLVLLQLMMMKMIYLLMLGLFLCLLQMFLSKSYKNLMILSSTESFNWLIMSFVFSVLNVIFIFIFYFVFMIIMIPKFNFNIMYFNWETVLIFLNLPFSVNFFVKIFSLAEIIKLDSLWVLILLFLMFMSILSLSFWLVNLSVNNVLKKMNYSMIVFFFIPCMVILLV